MDFSLNEMQEEFKRTARNFFTEQCDLASLQKFEEDESKYSEELYQHLAELGFLSIVIPEKYGGIEGDLLDLAIIIEEAGYATLAAPFFSTIAYGIMPLLKYGTEEQKQHFLPKISSGEVKFTGAFAEPNVNYHYEHVSVEATELDEQYVVSGKKVFVPYANAADYIVVLVRTDETKIGTEAGLTLLIVENDNENVDLTELSGISPEATYEVTFKDQSVPAENVLGEVNNGFEVTRDILETAAGLQTVEMAGVIRRALDITNSYVQERKQFNIPIATFQAVQHRLADMFTAVEGGYLAAYQAVSRLAQNKSASNEVAVAKTWLSQEGQHVLTSAHQLHGGIGVEMDYPLQFCFRHFKRLQLQLGNAPYYVKQLAKSIAESKEKQYA